MVEAKSLYIQALPGTGKTTIIHKLLDVGIYAVDGDDISRVYPKTFYPSRGERFAKVMARDDHPDVVLSSYWAKDFLPELNVYSSLVFYKESDAWMRDIRVKRPDLVETFDENTLLRWVASYDKLFSEYLATGSKPWFGEIVKLRDGEYLSDHIDTIVKLVKP